MDAWVAEHLVIPLYGGFIEGLWQVYFAFVHNNLLTAHELVRVVPEGLVRLLKDLTFSPLMLLQSGP